MKKVYLFLALSSLIVSIPKVFADQPQRTSSITVYATPTITASSAYTNVMQLGGVQTLTVSMDSRTGVELKDITVVDLDKQSSQIDVMFFSSLPTFTSAEHATWALSNANASLLIGTVNLPAANYANANAQSFLEKTGINLVMHPKPVTQVTGLTSTKIYAVAVSRGTPTYTTTSSLIFLYKFIQH